MHNDAVYALFDVESLIELSKRLKNIRNIEFRFIKIRTVANYET